MGLHSILQKVDSTTNTLLLEQPEFNGTEYKLSFIWSSEFLWFFPIKKTQTFGL